MALICLLLFMAFNESHSQSVLLASGGDASGSSGTANYSVGQTIQTTITDANGSAIQGIQFYFENSTLQIIDMDTNLDISTYPNPVTSILSMDVEGYQPNTLSYMLFDINGKLITNGAVTNKTTKINIDHLDMATYLLKVHNKTNQSIKTFKIIKE